MKGHLLLSIALALGSTAFVHAEDVLDAKLNALKQKAQHRAYSVSVTLANQNLVVPKTITDEEKALNAKVREMEKKLDTKSTGMNRSITPMRQVMQPIQKKPTNWLTPALLDEASSGTSPAEEETDSWVLAELTRQKNMRLEKQAQQEEKKLVDQRLREGFRANPATPYSQPNSYNNSLQNSVSIGIAGPQDAVPNLRSSYNAGSPARPSSPAALKPSSAPSLFSNSSRKSPASQPSKRASTFNKSPFQNLYKEEPEPLRKRVRPSSPSQTNPFEENLMPKVKQSIWD